MLWRNLGVVFFFCVNIFALQKSFADSEISARNLPEDQKILFFMGQNSDDLADYKKEVLDVDKSMPRPGGFTIYTSISVFPEAIYEKNLATRSLNSILGAGDWGDKEHNLKRSLEDYPDAAVAIGLDMSDKGYAEKGVSCIQIPLRAIAGTGDEDVKHLTEKYREQVDILLTTLKETERKIFLRISYEFDGPWNCYAPEPFKLAFRYIKKRIDELGAKNIATVWHSAAYLFDADKPHLSASTPTHYDDWYPGDDVVDWVGMSYFLSQEFETHQIPNAMDFAKVTPRQLQNKVVEFARKHKKPVLIAEASPQGYNLGDGYASPILLREEKPMKDKDLWKTWFKDWFDFIKDNRDVIRGVAYINSNWDSHPLWRCDLGAQESHGQSVVADANDPDALSCEGGVYWGDTRIQKNPYILAQFKKEMKKKYYVNGR